MNQTNKRQILAELLNGNVDLLRTYQDQLQIFDSPYRWIIDERSIGGNITVVYRDGNSTLINVQQLEKLAQTVNVWRIEDHSGNIRIPEPDDDR